MGSVKAISERISFRQNEGYTTLVIRPELNDQRKVLFSFWVFAWTFCGLYVLYELLFNDYPRELQLVLVIFLCFWAYYEYRIGYSWIWKQKGNELLKFEDGVLSYKRSIRTYGKAYSFYIDNIRDLRKVEIKPGFASVLSDSFWVLGSERIIFDYNGRVVSLGMQLNEEDTEKLMHLLKKIISEEKKKANV